MPDISLSEALDALNFVDKTKIDELLAGEAEARTTEIETLGGQIVDLADNTLLGYGLLIPSGTVGGFLGAAVIQATVEDHYALSLRNDRASTPASVGVLWQGEQMRRCGNSRYDVDVVPDGGGGYALWSIRRSDRKFTQLTSGVRAAALWIDDQDRVVYRRSTLSGDEVVWTPAEGVINTARPMHPSSDVVLNGDSLTEEASNTYGWDYWLDGLNGAATVANRAKSGQLSYQVAQGMGAVAINFNSVAGGSLPGNGAPVVALIPSQPLNSTGRVARSQMIRIRDASGVMQEALLSFPVVGDTTGDYCYMARRTVGPALTIPNGAYCVSDPGADPLKTNILGAGRNDLSLATATGTLAYSIGNPDSLLDQNVDACVEVLDQAVYYSQRIIIGLTLKSDGTENPASEAAIAARAYNARRAAKYGRAFIDMNAYLSSLEALDAAGISPSEADTIAIANGTPCPSLLQSDRLHFNDTCDLIIPGLVFGRMQEMRWYMP